MQRDEAGWRITPSGINVPLKVVSIPFGHDNNLQLHFIPPGPRLVATLPALRPFPPRGAPLVEQPSLLMMVSKDRKLTSEPHQYKLGSHSTPCEAEASVPRFPSVTRHRG